MINNLTVFIIFYMNKVLYVSLFLPLWRMQMMSFNFLVNGVAEE